MPTADTSKPQSKIYIHRENDRRISQDTVQFPVLDNDFNIVRKDRRRIVDRRGVNLKLIGQENRPISNSKELSIRIDRDNYHYLCDSSLDKFSMGRSSQNDVCINNKFVSREHAHISYSNGEFVLYDTSLNGTFLETEELGKIRLQGQKAYIYGEGKISLGTPIAREDQQLIYFDCK